jgi:CMP-N-acetylneuraminic acid synthetase
MKETVCFFLPTRKGSQRVKNKNTRPFSGIEGGILENKLRQLMNASLIDEVILSTNDELSIQVAEKIDKDQSKIKVVIRPDHLCLDTTNLTDLINYVPTITGQAHILWGHTTTPFINGNDYDEIIEKYFTKLKEGFDSLVTVAPLQNFILTPDGKMFNNDSKSLRWPRTQDLPLLYEVNHAAFMASRVTYIEQQNRIGITPYLFEQDKIKSFDIDWEDDFMIAEAIYEKIIKIK